MPKKDYSAEYDKMKAYPIEEAIEIAKKISNPWWSEVHV